MITAGQAGDSPQFRPVLDKIRVRSGRGGADRRRPDAVLGDKAYSAKANRAYLRSRRITAVIPEKVDQAAARRRKGSAGGRPVAFDPELYKLRNSVEMSKPGCCHIPALVSSRSCPSSSVLVLAA